MSGGAEAEDQPQRQGRGVLARERRVRAEHDEPQPLVAHRLAGVRHHALRLLLEIGLDREHRAAARAATASARSRSRIRRRALVSSQAGGFAGTPSRGQVRAAASKASASPSSARSSRRNWATRRAVSRPQWSRQAAPRRLDRRTGVPRRPGCHSQSRVSVIALDLDHRPHLDGVRRGQQTAQVEHDVHRLGLEQVEATELLDALGVRALGHHRRAVDVPQRATLGRLGERLAGHHRRPLGHRLVEGGVRVHHALPLLGGRGVPVALVGGQQHQVLHRGHVLS